MGSQTASIGGQPATAEGDIRIYSHLEGAGFPSGHVVVYVVFGGLLAYLAYTLVTQAAVRRALLALLVGLIALIGPSRVYLGHHWFIDVLASYLLGTALLIGLLIAYRRTKAQQLRALARPDRGRSGQRMSAEASREESASPGTW